MDKCPISGNKCPYLKTISIVDIENGKASNQMKVCYSCVGDYLGKTEEKKEKIANEDVLGVEDVSKITKHIKQMAELIDDYKTLTPLAAKEVPNKICPNCGITLEKITKEGRLGCAMCYDWFRTELDPIIHHAHDGMTKHVGKVPKKRNKEISEKQKINELEFEILKMEIEMETAIKKEDYETAASIRDELKKLKTN